MINYVSVHTRLGFSFIFPYASGEGDFSRLITRVVGSEDIFRVVSLKAKRGFPTYIVT